MPRVTVAGKGADPGRLDISLRSINQLFNSMDPSPFNERDLDSHAEQFLVSWAQELPLDAPLTLTLHLQETLRESNPSDWVPAAVNNYFAERVRMTRAELHRLLKRGRTSLAIGLAFLTSCLLLSEFLGGDSDAVVPGLLRESLTIAGWVAMWRPLQIYLYDWWPLLQRENLYRRMSRMPVELKPGIAAVLR